MTLKARVAELEIALTEIHAALEWLARTRNLGGCPIEWSVYPVPCDETGECPYPIEDQSDCWLQTALLKVSRRSIRMLEEEGVFGPRDLSITGIDEPASQEPAAKALVPGTRQWAQSAPLDEVRAWLDERGWRRVERDCGGWVSALITPEGIWLGQTYGVYGPLPSEEAATRALALAVIERLEHEGALDEALAPGTRAWAHIAPLDEVRGWLCASGRLWWQAPMTLCWTPNDSYADEPIFAIDVRQMTGNAATRAIALAVIGQLERGR